MEATLGLQVGVTLLQGLWFAFGRGCDRDERPNLGGSGQAALPGRSELTASNARSFEIEPLEFHFELITVVARRCLRRNGDWQFPGKLCGH